MPKGMPKRMKNEKLIMNNALGEREKGQGESFYQ
jgi:hypothetical protein